MISIFLTHIGKAPSKCLWLRTWSRYSWGHGGSPTSVKSDRINPLKGGTTELRLISHSHTNSIQYHFIWFTRRYLAADVIMVSITYGSKLWYENTFVQIKALTEWYEHKSAFFGSPGTSCPSRVPSASWLSTTAAADSQPASLARPASCVILWRGGSGVGGASGLFGSGPPADV